MTDHTVPPASAPTDWRKDALAMAIPLIPALILGAIAWGQVTTEVSIVRTEVEAEKLRIDQIEARVGKAETNEAVTAQALTDMKATLTSMDGKLDQAIGRRSTR